MNTRTIERLAKKIMEELNISLLPTEIALSKDVTIYKWDELECISTLENRFWKIQGRGYNEKAAVETLHAWGADG